MNDSIPICRSVFNHWVYQDPEHLKIWLTMLGRARYLPGEKTITYRDVSVNIKYGEFIFGYKKWEQDTGVSQQRLRTLVRRMVEDGMIQQAQATSHFTVFYIVNYSKFNSPRTVTQSDVSDNANSQPTVSQQSANSQPTTNKERIKKVKNISPSFDLFWKLYPKKEAKQDCIKLWDKIDDSEHSAIMAGLEAYKQSEKVKGGFVMGPDRWLRGRRWEDEMEESKPKQPNLLDESFWKGKL